jgi:hypothetical protein
MPVMVETAVAMLIHMSTCQEEMEATEFMAAPSPRIP